MKEVYIKDLTIGKKENLLCWIANKRRIKDNLFLDLYDSTGEIQAYVNRMTCQGFDELSSLQCESAVEFVGVKNQQGDFLVESYIIHAKTTHNLSPSPNNNKFNVFDERFSRQVIEHPTFYVRNKVLSSIYYIKSIFKQKMREYFFKKDFIEFEAPTLTKQTLYDDSGAIWLDVENQRISLSRCATFHLEPAVIAYEKVFTITNSHADEQVKTNRHLVEYLHLKAEMCWVSLEELISLAADLYYQTAIETYRVCKEKIDELVGEELFEQKLQKLNPKNHITITYDEAVDLLKANNFDFEYGKSLTTKQEQFLTQYYDENFLWVKYIPYTVEGFMFKRLPSNEFLTLTCDLIAPCGFGEILGCAEKMTDYEQIVSSMKEKGKFKDYKRYEDYALLHKYGLPEHGGIGMGIERALRYLLNINHVKYLKPFAVVKQTQINH